MAAVRSSATDGMAAGASAARQSPRTGGRVILAGNPNCGKSVVFNHLTGLYVNVSNFPGTTVDISQGSWQGNTLIDTPGVYGIGNYSDEERITRDSVLQADVVVNVVNATTLERDLFLTLQISDMGVPMVVVLNMMDEVERLGLSIDVIALQQAIGVPVLPVVAITGKGLDKLARTVAAARRGQPGMRSLQSMLTAKESCNQAGIEPRPAEQLLLAEGDPDIAARLGCAPAGNREAIYIARRRRADKLATRVVKDAGRRGLGQILGEWSSHPLIGLPILAAVLYGMYWLIGVVVAQVVVGFTEGAIMQVYYEPWIRQLLLPLTGDSSVVYRLLVGEFGLLTMTVTYLLGLLLPLVAGFYLVLSILEDSGYLPRVALLTDKLLNRIGLNGRAVIPMILGLGCVTMATFTTRVLASRRERTIALALLGIAIPCSAQLGVITALVAPFGGGVVLAYVLFIVIIYGLIGTVLNRLLPGESTDLLLDLPPLRLPRPGNILKKTSARVYGFLWEATPIFAAGVVLVAFLQETGALLAIQNAMAPLTVGWLQLPAGSAQAFIMGLVRRDFGAAGLYALSLTPEQKLTAAVTITLFVPCIASVLVLYKERGWREASAIFFSAIAIAMVTGGLVSRLAVWLMPILT